MDKDFVKLARDTLNNIFSIVENDFQDFDVDFEDEVLRFENDELVFILSIHGSSSEIWLSSPLSGAHHFKLKNKNDIKSWFSTRKKELNLYKLLESELKSASG